MQSFHFLWKVFDYSNKWRTTYGNSMVVLRPTVEWMHSRCDQIHVRSTARILGRQSGTLLALAWVLSIKFVGFNWMKFWFYKCAVCWTCSCIFGSSRGVSILCSSEGNLGSVLCGQFASFDQAALKAALAREPESSVSQRPQLEWYVGSWKLSTEFVKHILSS